MRFFLGAKSKTHNPFGCNRFTYDFNSCSKPRWFNLGQNIFLAQPWHSPCLQTEQTNMYSITTKTLFFLLEDHLIKNEWHDNQYPNHLPRWMKQSFFSEQPVQGSLRGQGWEVLKNKVLFNNIFFCKATFPLKTPGFFNLEGTDFFRGVVKCFVIANIQILQHLYP